MAKKQHLDLNRFLPATLKNETLSSLVSNLFNRFVSEERSVLINGRIGKQLDSDPMIAAANLEREVNAIIPAIYTQNATEQTLTVFDDMVNRLTVLNADVDNMQSWLREKYFNFHVPINYDMFVNYTQYYWIGDKVAHHVEFEGNAAAAPVYYVSERPSRTDLNKLPVRLATTRDIKLNPCDRADETITLRFTSSQHFTVTSPLGQIIVNNTSPAGSSAGVLSSLAVGAETAVTLYVRGFSQSGSAYGIQKPFTGTEQNDELLTFTIENGLTPFSTGDEFHITIQHRTSNIQVAFVAAVASGKGGISGTTSTVDLMYIDGHQVEHGDFILVRMQTDATQNGIYVVNAFGPWERAQWAVNESDLKIGAKVHVTQGTMNAGHTFNVLNKTSVAPGYDANADVALTAAITFSDLGIQSHNLSPWQQQNFWFHKDDFAIISQDYKVSIDDATQAARPIIQYDKGLQLNAAVAGQTPCDSSKTINDTIVSDGTVVQQIITKKNQVPLFDLYYYDGTHAAKTSSVFFYVEDPDFDIDSELGFRAKLTGDYDFVFGHGLKDDAGRLLFYKSLTENGVASFNTLWTPGLSTSTVVSLVAPAGCVVTSGPLADTQTWTLVYATATNEFAVSAERSGNVGAIVPGAPAVFDDVSITIPAGVYADGTTITFDILNTAFPRYVEKTSDGQIINVLGGPTNDGADGEIDGAWMTPLRMFHNLERESRSEVSQGDILNHFRSVIKSQDGFAGVSFGNNNTRNLAFNPGLGGTVREYAKEFPLLISMLIQKDFSPITLVDFAEQQYLLGLTSVDAFIAEALPTALSTGLSLALPIIDPNAPEIVGLLAKFEQSRRDNTQLADMFSDSTALVANWPITLPMMGLVPRVQPTIEFDTELGISVIVHHDGHVSPVMPRDAELDRALVRTVVARSDGTESAGIFSEAMPLTPYAGQLWLKPSVFELRIFDVTYDTNTAPTSGASGELWFNRQTQNIYEWDPIAQTWLLTSLTVANQWKAFSVDTLRNSLVLAVEQKLYASVHPLITVKPMLSLAEGSQYAMHELASFASKYSYDTFGTNYSVSDAFTWNYKQAVIAGIASPTPARWYDIYKEHFDIPGQSLATARPHLEPWKLLNLASKPVTWDAMYALVLPSVTVATTPVKYVSVNAITPSGIQVIDGATVGAGDRVLLVNQPNAVDNGIYVAGSGTWVRALDILQFNSTVFVQQGAYRAGTTWHVYSPLANPIQIGVTGVKFSQDKQWVPEMWAVIKAARPTLKLCVDVHTDTLLPPYVASSNPNSVEALTAAIPAGTSDVYVFGDNGPVENLWTKSLEYRYGLARSAFRLDPLGLLTAAWGDTYVSSYAGGVMLERDVMALHPHTSYLLHGEKLHNTRVIADVDAAVNGIITPVLATDKAHIVTLVVSLVEDNRTVFDLKVDGTTYAYISEGVTYPVLEFGGVHFANLSVNDFGIPFQLGDTIEITLHDDIVDPEYVPETTDTDDECLGCVVEGGVVVDDVPMVAVENSYSFTPVNTKRFLGLGQIFTNLLRHNYIDTVYSDAINAYRGWELKLTHRLGALVRTDTLSVNTIQGLLPSTGYTTLLKLSPNTDSLWITGLRVQLVEMGARTLNKYNTLIPSNDASDWKFRIETYNAHNPVIEKHVFNPTGDFQTFHALSKASTDLAWKKLTDVVAIEEVALPVTITGLQNVIDFLYGYISLLNERGWKIYAYDYSTIDAETGRNLDWQLEVEKLVDRVYSGVSAGEGHILNPFMASMTLGTPRGLLGRYTERTFIDMFSAQGVYDVTGSLIPVSQLNVIRTDEQAVTFSKTPMFSAHVFIDEYEHAIVFNKQFSDEIGAAKLFDPFFGARIDTAYLSYIRQEEPNGKPTFDGFFITKNEVKRNIVSSIDTMGSYYDAAQTFYEPDAAPHALALLGYTRKDYFDRIAVNDTTQFNFWRGLIQAKGTNMTIDAFVNYRKFTDASVDEYWAYKIASYGDAREKTLPEIKVNPQDATQKYLRLQFYSGQNTATDLLPLFTHIEDSDDTRWFGIDDLGKGMRFEAAPISETVLADASLTFPAYIKLTNIYHTGDSMAATVSGPYDSNVVSSRIIKVEGPGEYVVTGFTWLNPSKHSPMKLIDYENSVIASDIQLWHPAIGIHAQPALEIVDIIAGVDPARYNYTTQTVDNENFHVLKPWAKREVGRVWWDTKRLSYIPYEDANFFVNRDARLQRWGLLADWSSIQLNEWTESSVHPSKYDALAASEEGNADIDNRVKASGKVAVKKYYKRNRVISRRPIAWSHAGVGNSNAHPAFGPAEYVKAFANGKRIIPDTGRASAVNLIAGRYFGAWLNGKPVGQVLLNEDIKFLVGSSTNPSVPVITPATIASGTISLITITALDSATFGTRVGKIMLKRKNFGGGVSGIRMVAETGEYEDKSVTDWYSDDAEADSTLIVDFDTFGVRLAIVRSTFGVSPITADDIITAVTQNECDVYVREAISYTEIVPLPDSVFINDQTDPEYLTTDYEWRTWEVPTQDQLNLDLAEPFNEWKAYPGDWVTVAASPTIIAEMRAGGSTVTLRDGTQISRFMNDWTDWTVLSDALYEKVSDGSAFVTFTLPEVADANRISVYANGAQIKPTGYVITGAFIQVLGVQPEGTVVTLLNRAYAPSDADLKFDPVVSEDFSIQQQFKLDYEYTVISQRDTNGNPIGAKYYFWVTDKTIPKTGKSMSLSQASDILEFGPEMYAVMGRAVASTSVEYPAHFDSCAIAGLSRYVTRENAFKIRFLRDFTLRDDPEEMKLKNTHSEWKLIRRGQGKKIPTQLWELIVTAAAGSDAGGNQVPSQARIDYDERNNTSYRYGFGAGQIFADSDLVKTSIVDSILNTQLTLKIGAKVITDYITFLDFDDADEWFETAESTRSVMNMIYSRGRPSQINEIFFNVLEDALANNIEFTDLFKTSYITVSSSTRITPATQQEQQDELF